MNKARKVLPPRPAPNGKERRNLAREAARTYDTVPKVRADGLPEELEKTLEIDGYEVLVVLRLTDQDEVVIHRITVGDNRPERGQPYASTSQLSRVLAGLPFNLFQTDALREWPDYAMRQTQSGEWRWPDLEAVNRAKHRLGDGIEQAARIYLDHEKHSPVKAVAEQLNIGYETARKRIKTARERGLVPEAPGRGRRSHRKED